MVDHGDGIVRWPPVDILVKMDFRADSRGRVIAEQCDNHAGRPREGQQLSAERLLDVCHPNSYLPAVYDSSKLRRHHMKEVTQGGPAMARSARELGHLMP
jgi:hypothetical protein